MGNKLGISMNAFDIKYMIMAKNWLKEEINRSTVEYMIDYSNKSINNETELITIDSESIKI